MGRLNKTIAGRPNIKVHYRKLVEEYSGSCDSFDSLKIMPAIPEYLSYCCHRCGHTQNLKAEEVNSIVGNAFRMAYAAQLQKQTSFQDVISSQLDQSQADKVLWRKDLTSTFIKEQPSNQSQPEQTEMAASDSGHHRVPPNSIPGLKPAHKYNVLGPSDKSQSQQSTPGSEESNSPTEMNSYKKMTEKPPLIKRLAMGLTSNLHSADEDSCPLVSESNSSSPSSPSRPLSGGYVNELSNVAGDSRLASQNNVIENFKNDLVENISSNLSKQIDGDHSRLLAAEQDFKAKRISQISAASSNSYPHSADSTLCYNPKAPSLPERTDSLNNKEEGDLRSAPWFQAGIPREIALEVLGREPVGAFMVRESTSKPGCFALSLRVPRNFQPTGIAHYLIVRSNKGYKIKGFTKEFLTLSSLITHHSVMPELLPCPLSLSRYNPKFGRPDTKRDFADIDLDAEYNSLADFRKMMADLNV